MQYVKTRSNIHPNILEHTSDIHPKEYDHCAHTGKVSFPYFFHRSNPSLRAACNQPLNMCVLKYMYLYILLYAHTNRLGETPGKKQERQKKWAKKWGRHTDTHADTCTWPSKNIHAESYTVHAKYVPAHSIPRCQSVCLSVYLSIYLSVCMIHTLMYNTCLHIW